MSTHIYVSADLTNEIKTNEILRTELTTSNYESFTGSHFEQKEYGDDNLIYKAIIILISYEPDSTYIESDGRGGTCWCANITDSHEDECMVYYHFRKFEDLISIYDSRGYKFVNNYNK